MGDNLKGIVDIISESGLGSITDIFTSIVSVFKDMGTFLTDTWKLMTLSDELLDRINKPAEILIGSSSGYADSIAYRVYEAMIPLGVILMMIFFGLKLIELITNDEINIERFAKLFGYMILMLLFLNNGYSIMLKCYDAICGKDSEIMQSIMTPLKENFGSTTIFSSGNPLHDLLEDIPEDDGNLLAMLKDIANSLNRIIFMLFIPVLSIIPALLIRISFLTAIAMRAIKLAVHMSFTPIAFASVFDDNISTTKAVNHFKKILSLFLQGPLILIMMRITSFAISEAGSESFSPLLALFFTCTMMKRAIKGSEERADQMLGVN